ncbi:MAG: hypothetical protein IH606_10950 [Burkholderiales bacterium]|nr:hypothetical protein [Burkholderiales bacterium]
MPRLRRLAACCLAGALSSAILGAYAATAFDAIAPIFAQRCVMCHNGDAAPLGLRLDSLENVLKGSQKGAVVKSGDPDASELVRRIRGQSQPRMPLTGPPFLGADEIALIENWVAGGLVAGTGAAKPSQPDRPKAGEAVTYLHVAPILLQRCAKCHAANGLKGAPPEGYRLDTWEETIARADRLRVVPGNPAASELVRRIRGQALPRMPFDGPPYLAEEDILLIEQWIRQGARDAQGKPAPAPAGASLRLHGTLNNINNTWELDGLPLSVDAATRIDKRPGPGDYVEVRATVQRDGAVRANRIRRR